LLAFPEEEMASDDCHQDDECSFEDVSLFEEGNFVIEEVDEGRGCWILVDIVLIA
jgi:hypothetical protein